MAVSLYWNNNGTPEQIQLGSGGGDSKVSVIIKTETITSGSTFTVPAHQTMLVFVDGLLLKSGTDYTTSGTTVTLTESYSAGTEVTFELTIDGSRIVSDTTVATASSTFGLPTEPRSLAVYLDGCLCTAGKNYTFSGETVTFTSSVPVGTVLTFVLNL